MSQQDTKRGVKREAQFTYQKISLQLRRELIKLVVQQHFTVYRASRLLNINNSTAKAIIRKFRKNGHVFVRKTEKNQTQEPLENRNQQSEELDVVEQQQIPTIKECEAEVKANNMFYFCLPLESYYTLQSPYYFVPYA